MLLFYDLKIFSIFFSSDQNVRYCVLASLDEKFDPHLAQSENLNALFIALNDEMFEIRELALCTIGRLSAVNPAYVMPSLRKVLIQVIFLILMLNVIINFCQVVINNNNDNIGVQYYCMENLNILISRFFNEFSPSAFFFKKKHHAFLLFP